MRRPAADNRTLAWGGDIVFSHAKCADMLGTIRDDDKKRKPLRVNCSKGLQKGCMAADDVLRLLVALISDTGMRLAEVAGLHVQFTVKLLKMSTRRSTSFWYQDATSYPRPQAT